MQSSLEVDVIIIVSFAIMIFFVGCREVVCIGNCARLLSESLRMVPSNHGKVLMVILLLGRVIIAIFIIH